MLVRDNSLVNLLNTINVVTEKHITPIMFEYKFWHVYFFSFLGFLSTSSSHSWTKETAASMLVLSTERIVHQ